MGGWFWSKKKGPNMHKKRKKIKKQDLWFWSVLKWVGKKIFAEELKKGKKKKLIKKVKKCAKKCGCKKKSKKKCIKCVKKCVGNKKEQDLWFWSVLKWVGKKIFAEEESKKNTT